MQKKPVQQWKKLELTNKGERKMSRYKYKDSTMADIEVSAERYAIDPSDFKKVEAAKKELQEVYIKADAFDLIDGYLTEAYNNYHDVEDVELRRRLISGFISRKVTLLFQEMIEKYGNKEGE